MIVFRLIILLLTSYLLRLLMSRYALCANHHDLVENRSNRMRRYTTVLVRFYYNFLRVFDTNLTKNMKSQSVITNNTYVDRSSKTPKIINIVPFNRKYDSL